MEGIQEAMTWLGQQPDVLFLGQGVGGPGTRLSASFEGVPAEKRLEMPVAENLQLGLSIGLALEGFTPVSVFPRVNFLFCAMDQLVNHLDKLPLYSEYKPKIIIRTAVGSKEPLDAGPQHTGDYTASLARMLQTVKCRCLWDNSGRSLVQDFSSMEGLSGWYTDASPLEVYKDCYADPRSALVVEK